jgi:hypothetical protein
MTLAAPTSPSARAETPGDTLRRAREAQGLSLDDLSRLTKISVSKLTALEHNDLDLLPGEVYVRGFLRAYAREVELDPEETVQRYFEHIHAEQEMVAVTVPHAGALASHRGPVAMHAVAHDEGHPASDLNPKSATGQWVAGAVAVIGLIAYLTFTQTHAPSNDAVQAAAPAGDAAHASGSGTPDQAATAANTAVPNVLQFELQPQGPCWISANVDGEPVLSKLLQAGDHHTFQVHDELVIRVGDPGAVTYSINGQPGRPLGRAGEPINVRITKDNYRDFVSSAS